MQDELLVECRKSVGMWLKGKRIGAGYSVDKFSKALEVPEALWGQIESGEVAVPLKILARLRDITNYDPAELIRLILPFQKSRWSERPH